MGVPGVPGHAESYFLMENNGNQWKLMKISKNPENPKKSKKSKKWVGGRSEAPCINMN